MDAIWEKARDIGRLLVQTDEYKALKQANDRLGEDRETVTVLNEVNRVQQEIAAMLRSGREPDEEKEKEYEKLVEQIQQRSAYQAVVAAQSNFDRLMMRINEEIAAGIEAGEQSRIILPS